MTLPHFSTFEIVTYAILVIPTTYAMLTGAPFVPTSMKQVDRMLKVANLKPGMIVYDLGSGDGRLVHKAANEYKVLAIGYEFSPLIWLWAKFLSFFWHSSAELRFGNFWRKDLSNADVIFCYLLDFSMNRMKHQLLPHLKPGTLIVSHAFRIHGLAPWKKLPSLREQKLGPVWIYKKSSSKKVKRPGQK